MEQKLKFTLNSSTLPTLPWHILQYPQSKISLHVQKFKWNRNWSWHWIIPPCPYYPHIFFNTHKARFLYMSRHSNGTETEVDIELFHIAHITLTYSSIPKRQDFSTCPDIQMEQKLKLTLNSTLPTLLWHILQYPQSKISLHVWKFKWNMGLIWTLNSTLPRRNLSVPTKLYISTCPDIPMEQEMKLKLNSTFVDRKDSAPSGG